MEDQYYCNFRLGGPYATLGRDYASSLHDARARQLPGCIVLLGACGGSVSHTPSCTALRYNTIYDCKTLYVDGNAPYDS